MFSATWPKEVELLAQDYTSGEGTVHVQIGDPQIHANKRINQIVQVVDQADKY